MRINPLFIIPTFLMVCSSAYASTYTLSVSADTTEFDYTETNGAVVLDTETRNFGNINGFTINLEPKVNGFYAGGSYAEGNTDYIGGTDIDPTYGSHRTVTKNRIIDYSVGYKATTIIDSKMEMPVKFGLGYREWLRDIQSTPTVSGVGELYDWGYLDFGIGLHYLASSNLTIGIDGNVRKAFSAEMYENIHGATFKLKNVYGYKISVPLDYALNASWSGFFVYNYEYWNIGASDPVGGYYEPDSKTKNHILSAGLKFRF